MKSLELNTLNKKLFKLDFDCSPNQSIHNQIQKWLVILNSKG